MVVVCLRDIACFWAYYWSPRSYFSTYWISNLVSALFILLATYELFIKRLFLGFYKFLFYRHLFSIAGVLTIAVAISTVIVGNIGLAPLPNAIHVLHVLQIAALLFFVALMSFMGRSWGPYELGIAVGLGLNTAAFVIVFVIFMKSGPLHGIVRELPSIAFDLACLISLITFLKPEKPTRVSADPMSPEIIGEAQKWEKTLKRSWTGKKPSK